MIEIIISVGIVVGLFYLMVIFGYEGDNFKEKLIDFWGDVKSLGSLY